MPPKDMDPSISELRTILWSVGSRVLDKNYQCHRIIPFPLSDIAFVLFKAMSTDQTQLILRMTPIVDFTAGEKEKWNDFIQTLCWIVGEPVGVTT
ncbi:hypothetical protein F4818DRAFT_437823 [Hypoxylon cercidicola]|nr:hypothetical protein F4818DRAFT_437823 [Hypoxylon cercidicola]